MDGDMNGDLVVFNGIDASTGNYLLTPMPVDEVVRVALGISGGDPIHVKELRQWHHRVTESTFGPKEGVDPKNLWQTGWGVIFAAGADPAIREALRPLLERRQRQSGRVQEHYYREFIGDDGYRAGESKQEFLRRHGAGPGPANPDAVPYYLLIVGDPRDIPYSFACALDVQYAVGRLCFDRVEDYANYARSVVEAESAGVRLPRKATFFATRHPGDMATELSSGDLAAPLAHQLAAGWPDWEIDDILGEAATKEHLGTLMGGESTPALLFTATHGVGLPEGHPQQLRHQGALLCQDWPGHRNWLEPLSDKLHFFSADDVAPAGNLLGLVAFHFACYGAGTPQFDDFNLDGKRTEIAPYPLVSALPKQLLGHPDGGALAVVGHVDRAWAYSFHWPGAGRQTETYRSCLARLLDGHPVGSAFEYLNERYAELSVDLHTEFEDIEAEKRPNPPLLAAMWTAHNDARSFTILGDPAVRLLGGVEDAETVVPTPVAVLREAAGPEISPSAATTAPATSPSTAAPSRPPEPAAPPATAQSRVGPDLSELDYGVLDGIRQMRERLATALSTVAENVGDALQRAVENATVLEVATYVAGDLAAVTFDEAAKRFDGARLAALTRLSIDGDAVLLLPDAPEGINDDVSRLHVAMVEQARISRQEMVKTAASTVGGLLDALKVL